MQVTYQSEHCPWKDVTEFAFYCGSLFRHYQAGFLLHKGAIDDQPNWYLDAMATLNSRLLEHQKAENKRLQEQAEHRKHGG